MQVQISSEQLTAALTFAGQGVPSRPPVPVLGGVRLQATASGFTVEGFDYETHATERVQGVISTGPSEPVVVSHARLLKCAKLLPKRSTVHLATDGDQLTMKGDDGSSFRFEKLAADEYPDAPSVPTDRTVLAMTGTELLDALTRVGSSVSTDYSLPVLTAACFSSTKGTVRIQTTDRFRMSEYDTGVLANTEAPNILVPFRPLMAAAKSFKGAEKVTMTADAERVALTDGDRTVITLTGDGEFPPVDAIWPSESTATLTVPAKETVAAVKQITAASDEKRPTVRIENPDRYTARLVVSEGGRFEAAKTVKADATAATPDVGFSAAYLTDALNAVGGDVHMSFWQSAKPVVFTGDELRYRHLVMPVRSVQ